MDIEMTFEIGLTLGIIVMALVLFATEKLRVDLIALIVLLLAAITGLVSKDEVFSGFANPCSDYHLGSLYCFWGAFQDRSGRHTWVVHFTPVGYRGSKSHRRDHAGLRHFVSLYE
jgi:hypothetical protein